jgi:hypothetical protein
MAAFGYFIYRYSKQLLDKQREKLKEKEKEIADLEKKEKSKIKLAEYLEEIRQKLNEGDSKENPEKYLEEFTQKLNQKGADSKITSTADTEDNKLLEGDLKILNDIIFKLARIHAVRIQSENENEDLRKTKTQLETEVIRNIRELEEFKLERQQILEKSEADLKKLTLARQQIDDRTKADLRSLEYKTLNNRLIIFDLEYLLPLKPGGSAERFNKIVKFMKIFSKQIVLEIKNERLSDESVKDLITDLIKNIRFIYVSDTKRLHTVPGNDDGKQFSLGDVFYNDPNIFPIGIPPKDLASIASIFLRPVNEIIPPFKNLEDLFKFFNVVYWDIGYVADTVKEYSNYVTRFEKTNDKAYKTYLHNRRGPLQRTRDWFSSRSAEDIDIPNYVEEDLKENLQLPNITDFDPSTPSSGTPECLKIISFYQTGQKAPLSESAFGTYNTSVFGVDEGDL